MVVYTFLGLPEPEVMDLPLDKQPYFDVSEKKIPLAALASRLLDNQTANKTEEEAMLATEQKGRKKSI